MGESVPVGSHRLQEIVEPPVALTGEERDGRSRASSAIDQQHHEPALTLVSNVISFERGDHSSVPDALQQRFPMPAIADHKAKALRFKMLSTYHRLMIAALLTNAVGLIVAIAFQSSNGSAFSFGSAATVTGINLSLTVLMRHEQYINLLFKLIVAIPDGFSLRSRRAFAKFAYSQGGVHAGCGISSFAWHAFYTVLVATQLKDNKKIHILMIVFSSLTGLLLLANIVLSYPTIRHRFHDVWEMMHRYAGYLAILSVWTQTMLIAIFASDDDVGTALLRTPNFWLLILITCFIIHPWLYLRRLRFIATPLSGHATRLWFRHQTPAPCRATRLAFSALGDYHGFATIPDPDVELGYSVIVSSAGDFTRELICNPPTHLWTKGALTTGVMRIATLFKPVVVVATGSGIGPCLSFLHVFSDYPVRVIWSARSPLLTYQHQVMRSVLRADPSAIIVDTQVSGHPNLPALTFAACKATGAEAVIVISNPKVTSAVVFEMEARDIAAFGAIFDS